MDTCLELYKAINEIPNKIDGDELEDQQANGLAYEVVDELIKEDVEDTKNKNIFKIKMNKKIKSEIKRKKLISFKLKRKKKWIKQRRKKLIEKKKLKMTKKWEKKRRKHINSKNYKSTYGYPQRFNCKKRYDQIYLREITGQSFNECSIESKINELVLVMSMIQEFLFLFFHFINIKDLMMEIR